MADWLYGLCGTEEKASSANTANNPQNAGQGTFRNQLRTCNQDSIAPAFKVPTTNNWSPLWQKRSLLQVRNHHSHQTCKNQPYCAKWQWVERQVHTTKQSILDWLVMSDFDSLTAQTSQPWSALSRGSFNSVYDFLIVSNGYTCYLIILSLSKKLVGYQSRKNNEGMTCKSN